MKFDYIERSSTPDKDHDCDRSSDRDHDCDRERDTFCGRDVDASRDFDWDWDKY